MITDVPIQFPDGYTCGEGLILPETSSKTAVFDWFLSVYLTSFNRWRWFKIGVFFFSCVLSYFSLSSAKICQICHICIVSMSNGHPYFWSNTVISCNFPFLTCCNVALPRLTPWLWAPWLYAHTARHRGGNWEIAVLVHRCLRCRVVVEELLGDFNFLTCAGVRLKW